MGRRRDWKVKGVLPQRVTEFSDNHRLAAFPVFPLFIERFHRREMQRVQMDAAAFDGFGGFKRERL